MSPSSLPRPENNTLPPRRSEQQQRAHTYCLPATATVLYTPGARTRSLFDHSQESSNPTYLPLHHHLAVLPSLHLSAPPTPPSSPLLPSFHSSSIQRVEPPIVLVFYSNQLVPLAFRSLPQLRCRPPESRQYSLKYFMRRAPCIGITQASTVAVEKRVAETTRINISSGSLLFSWFARLVTVRP